MVEVGMFHYAGLAIIYCRWRRRFRKMVVSGMVCTVHSKHPIKLWRFASLALRRQMSSLTWSKYLLYLSSGRETRNWYILVSHPIITFVSSWCHFASHFFRDSIAVNCAWYHPLYWLDLYIWVKPIVVIPSCYFLSTLVTEALRYLTITDRIYRSFRVFIFIFYHFQ